MFTTPKAYRKNKKKTTKASNYFINQNTNKKRERENLKAGYIIYL